jgi:uncharacterized membrane protein YraQ (UPF0718 family)
MTQATIVLAAVALTLTAVAWRKGNGLAARGLLTGAKSLRGQLPMLLIAFLLAGFVEALVPAELVRRWLSAEAGLKGILIGCVAGGMLPFGPYVVFPMAAAIRAAGAGDATIVAFVIGWMMWSTSKIAYEMATLGPGFTWRRMGLFLLFPPAAGVLAHMYFLLAR